MFAYDPLAVLPRSRRRSGTARRRRRDRLAARRAGRGLGRASARRSRGDRVTSFPHVGHNLMRYRPTRCRRDPSASASMAVARIARCASSIRTSTCATTSPTRRSSARRSRLRGRRASGAHPRRARGGRRLRASSAPTEHGLGPILAVHDEGSSGSSSQPGRGPPQGIERPALIPDTWPNRRCSMA
jgi:soluble lytic murein transglycosylase-like protein